MQFEDLTGRKFGRLTVVSRGQTLSKRTRWNCSCSCGGLALVGAPHLKSGHTTSCGCTQIERAKIANSTHGLTKTSPVYIVWRNMKRRCYSARSADFKFYGSRGISVCPQGRDLKYLHAWALSSGYAKGLTLERKNVDGNYCPENCCWVTMQEQHYNKRCTIRVKVFGHLYTSKELILKYGLGKSMVSRWIKEGVDFEKRIKEKHGI